MDAYVVSACMDTKDVFVWMDTKGVCVCRNTKEVFYMSIWILMMCVFMDTRDETMCLYWYLGYWGWLCVFKYNNAVYVILLSWVKMLLLSRDSLDGFTAYSRPWGISTESVILDCFPVRITLTFEQKRKSFEHQCGSCLFIIHTPDDVC